MITMVMLIEMKGDDGGDQACNLKFPDFTQLAGIWNIWLFKILGKKTCFCKSGLKWSNQLDQFWDLWLKSLTVETSAKPPHQHPPPPHHHHQQQQKHININITIIIIIVVIIISNAITFEAYISCSCQRPLMLSQFFHLVKEASCVLGQAERWISFNTEFRGRSLNDHRFIKAEISYMVFGLSPSPHRTPSLSVLCSEYISSVDKY